MKMRLGLVVAACALGALLVAPPAHAVTQTVSSQANIFGAGHAAPPGTGCSTLPNGAGALPPSSSFAAGSLSALTFSSVTGQIRPQPGPDSGPDGSTIGGKNIQSTAGIASADDNGARFYLTGVFLTDAEPADPAPARLDFGSAGLGRGFSTLSPLIGQVFFIGDGLTGTGTGAVQQFQIPPTATRLFLGLEDAQGWTGSPGCYQDNVGSLSIANNLPDATATQCKKAKKKRKKKGKNAAQFSKKKKKKKSCKKKKKKKKKR
jgi:hypothetical protein